jgi:hypothetical protein
MKKSTIINILKIVGIISVFIASIAAAIWLNNTAI